MSSDPRNPSVPADAMAGIRVVFFEECDEHLAELETGLLALQEGDREPETVNVFCSLNVPPVAEAA